MLSAFSSVINFLIYRFLAASRSLLCLFFYFVFWPFSPVVSVLIIHKSNNLFYWVRFSFFFFVFEFVCIAPNCFVTWAVHLLEGYQSFYTLVYFLYCLSLCIFDRRLDFLFCISFCTRLVQKEMQKRKFRSLSK